jgi:hypothetical protein
VIDTAWQQAGALIASAWLIYGMVKLSWFTGTKFWTRD